MDSRTHAMDDNTFSELVSLDLSDSWLYFQQHIRDVLTKLQNVCASNENRDSADVSFLFAEDKEDEESSYGLACRDNNCTYDNFGSNLVEYEDNDSLISDFQILLADPLPNDASIILSDGVRLPLPSQVLRERSCFFGAMLSTRWATPSGRFQKPDASSIVFADVLEHLVTGAVTLSGETQNADHNVELLVLANQLLLPSLECVVATHISKCLTISSFPFYLSARAFSPPDNGDYLVVMGSVPSSLEYVVSSFAVAHLQVLCSILPLTWQCARPLWYLLSSRIPSNNTEEMSQVGLHRKNEESLTPALLLPFSIYLSKVVREVSVAAHIENELPHVRAALIDLLLSTQSAELITKFSSLGILSSDQCSILSNVYQAPFPKSLMSMPQPSDVSVKTMFSEVQYFESIHPHTSPSGLGNSLREVLVPSPLYLKTRPPSNLQQAVSSWSSLLSEQPPVFNEKSAVSVKSNADTVLSVILFDRYCSFGPDARLVFFLDRPENDEDLSGIYSDYISLENVPPTYIVLPATQFWFAFIRNVSEEQRPFVPNWWGWRFGVFPALRQDVCTLETLFG